MVKGRKRARGLQVQKSGAYVRKWKKDDRKRFGTVTICYTPQICPDVMRVSLPYNINRTFSGTFIGDAVFRGNGPNDPEFALGGGQPIGFDQWSAFYRRYRVLASKIEMQVINRTQGTTIHVVPMNTSAALTDVNQILEQQYAKTILLGANQDDKKIVHYMDTATIRGVPKQGVRIEANLSALNTSVPLQEWFWHIGGSVPNIADSFVFDCNITITYYMEWCDRETLIRS